MIFIFVLIVIKVFLHIVLSFMSLSIKINNSYTKDIQKQHLSIQTLLHVLHIKYKKTSTKICLFYDGVTKGGATLTPDFNNVVNFPKYHSQELCTEYYHITLFTGI